MKFDWLLCLSLVACGGHASVDASPTDEPARSDAGAEMMGTSPIGSDDGGSVSQAGEPQDAGDRGSLQCGAPAPITCKYVPVDAPDFAPDQRWGTLEDWQSLIANCTAYGDVFVTIDDAGCVATVEPDDTAFSTCVVADLEPFKWPCAAGRRLNFYISSGPK